MAGVAVESIYIDVLLNGKKAQMGLKQLNKQLKGLNKPTKAVSGIFGKLFKFAGIAGFAKMAFDAHKFGRELGLISTKTGIAAEKIAKMQRAFAATGGDAKEIANVMQNITAGLARLSMGSGEMAAKLASMGISAWEGGRPKTSDVVLGDIAEWTKSQLEMGRSMQEISQFLQDNFNMTQAMVNMMAMGRGGYEAYQRNMGEMTGSLTEEEIDNLQELNISFSRLKATLVVLTEKVGAGLSPALVFLMDIIQYAAKGYQKIWKEFSDVFGLIFDEIGGATEAFEGLKLLVDGVVAIGKILVDILGLATWAVKEAVEAVVDFFFWLASLMNKDKWEELKSQAGQSILNTFGVKSGLMTKEEAERKVQEVQYRLRAGNVSTKNEKLFPESPLAQSLTQADVRGSNALEAVIENNININVNGNADVNEIKQAAFDGSNQGITQGLNNTMTGGY